MGQPPGTSPQHTVCTSALPWVLVLLTSHFTDCHLAWEYMRLAEHSSESMLLGKASCLPSGSSLPRTRTSGRVHCGSAFSHKDPRLLPTNSTTGPCWHLLSSSHWPGFHPPISRIPRVTRAHAAHLSVTQLSCCVLSWALTAGLHHGAMCPPQDRGQSQILCRHEPQHRSPSASPHFLGVCSARDAKIRGPFPASGGGGDQPSTGHH